MHTLSNLNVGWKPDAGSGMVPALGVQVNAPEGPGSRLECPTTTEAPSLTPNGRVWLYVGGGSIKRNDGDSRWNPRQGWKGASLRNRQTARVSCGSSGRFGHRELLLALKCRVIAAQGAFTTGPSCGPPNRSNSQPGHCGTVAAKPFHRHWFTWHEMEFKASSPAAAQNSHRAPREVDRRPAGS